MPYLAHATVPSRWVLPKPLTTISGMDPLDCGVAGTESKQSRCLHHSIQDAATFRSEGFEQ